MWVYFLKLIKKSYDSFKTNEYAKKKSIFILIILESKLTDSGSEIVNYNCLWLM